MSSSQARRIADEVGISYRQLDHWIAQGWVSDRLKGRFTGSGHERSFNPEEIEVVMLAASLVNGFGVGAEKACAIAHMTLQGLPTRYGGWVLQRIAEPSDENGQEYQV